MNSRTYPVWQYRILVAQVRTGRCRVQVQSSELESNFSARVRHIWQGVCSFNTSMWNNRLRTALRTLFHLEKKVKTPLGVGLT